MNRLWARPKSAFALAILVAVGTVALLAALTAGQAFRFLPKPSKVLHNFFTGAGYTAGSEEGTRFPDQLSKRRTISCSNRSACQGKRA